MTVCIVTGSTDRDWVRALASLPRRGVGAIAVRLDDSYVGDGETDRRARRPRRGPARPGRIRHHPVPGACRRRHPGQAPGRRVRERAGCPGCLRVRGSFSRVRAGCRPACCWSCCSAWAGRPGGRLAEADGFPGSGRLVGLLLGSLLALGPRAWPDLPISAIVGAGIVMWAVGGEYFAVLSQGDSADALRGDASLVPAPASPRHARRAHTLRRRAGHPDVDDRFDRRLAMYRHHRAWRRSLWSARCCS